MLLVVALFPFLHNTKYAVTLVSCKPDEIVLQHEQNRIKVSLFNVHMKQEEEGWIQACSLLEEASDITFEIDASSKIEEPIPVWLFADDILIQEELVKQDYAFPVIHNPEYTYEKRLEEAVSTTQAIAQEAESDERRKWPMQGPIFLFMLLLIWSVFVWYIMKIYRQKQK